MSSRAIVEFRNLVDGLVRDDPARVRLIHWFDTYVQRLTINQYVTPEFDRETRERGYYDRFAKDSEARMMAWLVEKLVATAATEKIETDYGIEYRKSVWIVAERK